MTVRAAALISLLLLTLSGCGTTATTETAAVSGDTTGGAGDTQEAADTAVPDTTPADTTPVDTSPPPPREAPPLPTPDRSLATSELYCGLSNGQFVQGALRGAACLNLPAAAFLDDLSRGMFYGEVLLAGYTKATFGSCAFVQCLNDATDCEQARACDAARLLGPCDQNERVRRCDGSTLEACLWDGTAYRWYRTTDCERVGAECVERVCPNGACLPTATCVREPMIEFCDYYGRCDGNNLVRCMPNDGAASYAMEVTLDCGSLAEGGSCIETPVGGEVPGPACVAPEPDCVNAFGGASCASERELTLCLFGRKTTVDCTAYGYDRCEAGQSSFESRCVR